MNWKQRGYGLLSVFFYGYSAGFAGVLGYGATTIGELSAFNLVIFPGISGIAMTLPKLGKTFAELSNNE